MLFERFEKQLDLPAIPIDAGNRRGPQRLVVRHKENRVSCVRVDHAQHLLCKSYGLCTGELHAHVAMNVPMFRTR